MGRRWLAAAFAQCALPIVGVAIGADADNTHGHSLGHVAALVLAP